MSKTTWQIIEVLIGLAVVGLILMYVYSALK